MIVSSGEHWGKEETSPSVTIMKPSLSGEPKPLSLSVGICAHNEEATLGTMLQTVFEQQLPPGTELKEVLVVSSGSTDETNAILAETARREKRLKPIIEERRLGKASALNWILQVWSGDVLILATADSLLTPHAFAKLVEKLQAHPQTAVVSGHPLPIVSPNFMGRIVSLLWRLHDATLATLNDQSICSHATGELMCIRRGVVEEIPAATVNEDAYIATKAHREGSLVKYASEAVVHIDAPLRPHDLIEQRRRVLFGHHQVRQLLGRYPSTLESITFKDLKTAVGIVWSTLGNPRDLLALLTALVLEGLATGAAFFDQAHHSHRNFVWKTVHTTGIQVTRGRHIDFR